MPTIHHNVRMVSQQFSPVCWLACAAMIFQHTHHQTPTADQLGMEGEDFRTPGYTVPPEAPDNPEMYAYLRRIGFTVTTSPRVRGEMPRAAPPARTHMAPPRSAFGSPFEMTPAEQLIHWLLVNKGPFILNHHAGAFSYGPTRAAPAAGGAHAVVITGLETNAPRSRVYFNNPWGDRDVTTTTTSIEAAWLRWERAGGQSIAYL